MDTLQAPPSDDGIYGLAEVDLAPSSPRVGAAPPTPAAPRAEEVKPAAEKKPKPPKESSGGLFAMFGRKKPAAEPTAPAASPAAPEPTSAATPPAEAAPRPATPPAAPKILLRKKKKRNTLRYTAPAWVVSALVHLGLLGLLGAVAVTAEAVRKPKSIDSAPFDPKLSGDQAAELVHIYADPSSAPRDQAVFDTASASTPGAGAGLGTGTGPPSATPRVGVTTAVGEGTSLPQVKVVANLSGVSLLPNMPSRDFAVGSGGNGGGGGGISGDVTMGTKDVGEALDQLAREILRHLQSHKLTVVWLFDESGSMKDDQRAIKEKFSRVTSELRLNTDDDKKAAGALRHAVIGFGESIHKEVGKPTDEMSTISRAIDRLTVDMSGIENTCQAIQAVVKEYSGMIKDDRRLIIVLVTDESGDDGQYVEEARQALVSRGIPLYVIGRQSLFGYETAHMLYTDPVTKEQYWPSIRRGPESADVESLRIDGLHDRWDEQPSGFAPYELARLAKDSGGIYFLLPSEETMRVRQREKAYSMSTLKEYVPSYESRMAYVAHREKSELRKLIYEIVQFTSKDFTHRRDYPIDPQACVQVIAEEVPKARARLSQWVAIEKRLRDAQKLRDREPDKRWQAHYDLLLAQSVAYQIKAYEYLACIDEMVALMKQGKLKPEKMPIKDQLDVNWVINHSTDKKAPKKETEKKYVEAKRLFDLVIQRHPKTPWADLALDEINRGFGCRRDEEHHGPGYAERAKLVPKY